MTRPAHVAKTTETIFAVWCVDGENAPAIRDQYLEGHLAYVEENHDRYLTAGPLRRDQDKAITASLFIIRAASEEDARAFMHGDPYISEGAYQSVDYRAFTPAAGEWVGGVIWQSAQALRNSMNQDG